MIYLPCVVCSILLMVQLLIVSVIPAGAIQISSGEGGQNLHTLTMTNSTTGGAIVQYAQGQEFFVPGIKRFCKVTTSSVISC